VVNYVVEKFLLDKPLDPTNSDGSFGVSTGQIQFPPLGDNSLRAGAKSWQKLKPTIEILCNNQVHTPYNMISFG
jgi:WD repeat-containing protein 48